MLLDSSAIDIYMFSPQTPATVPDFWKRGLLYQSRPDFIIFFLINMNSTAHVPAQSSKKGASTTQQWEQLARMDPGFSYKSFSSHQFK